jgi:pimeloyl-ACP methyl ester carboxylesterase
MIRETEFRFIDRKKNRNLVLVPGWATDHRIFGTLELDYNYILADKFWPGDFSDKLFNFLKTEDINEVSLLGLSLGGFCSADFAVKYPAAVSELFLVGIRKKYPESGLDRIAGYLTQNKELYLRKFYQECFINKAESAWFDENLRDSYCRQFDLEYLTRTLDCLRRPEFSLESLDKEVKVEILHGSNDKIALLDEARKISQSRKGCGFVLIESSGHIPFFTKDFKL